jgi:hypothetical protein
VAGAGVERIESATAGAIAGGRHGEITMVRHHLIAVCAIACATAMASPAAGQTSGSITLGVPVQRTSVAGEPSATEPLISADGVIDYGFGGDRGRLFYETSLDRFDAGGAWSTWLHNVGAAGTFKAGGAAIDAGAAVFWRANSGGWSDAGFRGFNLASGIEREFTRATLGGGYSFYKRTFDEVPTLDQIEHFGHMRALANFETRTTIVGAVSAGWKHYDGGVVPGLDDAPIDASPAMASRGPQGWRWLGTAPGISLRGAGAARTQFTWLARIAQSVADRTGVWLEHERRATAGDTPPAVVWTPPMFYDDGVYDDPYAIDSATWRAGAKQVLARGDVRATLIHSVRDFAGVAVVAADGQAGPGRADRLMRAGIDVTVAIWSSRGVELDLLGAYGFVRNRSNDPFESYRAHVISTGLRAGF